jgi:hypothetical protein
MIKNAYISNYNQLIDNDERKYSLNWHQQWQNCFLNTEIQFKGNDHQIKNRRADVSFSCNSTIKNNKLILELQNSYIDNMEVGQRKHDYRLHDHSVIWLLNGKDDYIDCKYHDDYYTLTFKQSWLYKSFENHYDFILIDINSKIFFVPVNKIKSKMIRLKKYVSKEKLLEVLNSKEDFHIDNVWNLWEDDNYVKSIFTIDHFGAGNGKTYSLWENIIQDAKHYSFIVLTDQHSAKEVIKKELDDQIDRREEYITIEEVNKVNEEFESKKFFITIYCKKTGKNKKEIVVASFCSFLWALTKSPNSNYGIDYYHNLRKKLANDKNFDKVHDDTGCVKYGKSNFYLNSNTRCYIDETQDLLEIDYEILIHIMKKWGVDFSIVGDTLQSLKHKNNILTRALALNDIDQNNSDFQFDVKPFKNDNRRMTVNLAEPVNKLIHFEKYGLPPINPINKLESLKNNEAPLEVFEMPDLFSKEDKLIESCINQIIGFIDYQIKTYNYKPKDISIIFSVFKGHNLHIRLENALTEYFLNLYHPNEANIDFGKHKYVQLHQSQENRPIDLSESVECTRIYSTFASKGDGRELVIAMGYTEKNIKYYSNKEENIVFESHLHVPLTRAKRKVYFGLVKNNDIIHRRFEKAGLSNLPPDVRKSFRFDQLKQEYNFDKINIHSILENEGICEFDLTDEHANHGGPHELNDWDYHKIRYPMTWSYLIYYAIENRINEFSQIKTILKKLQNLPVKVKNRKEFWEYLGEFDFLHSFDTHPDPHFPINSHCQYKEQTELMVKTVEKIQKETLVDNNISSLDPYEMFIFHYMSLLFTQKKYTDISPDMVHKITYYFQKEQSNKNKKFLEKSKNIINRRIKETLSDVLSNKDITWNIYHRVKYEGDDDDLLLYTTFPLIGHDSENVHQIVLTTDYNFMNKNELILKILVDRMILRNANHNERRINNHVRFFGKNIITYVMILNDKYDFKKFEWRCDDKYESLLKNELKISLIKCFKTSEVSLYNFFVGNKIDDCIQIYKKENNNLITNFFKELKREKKKSKKNYQNIRESLENFRYFFMEYIESKIDNYLKINDDDSDSDTHD